MNPGRLRKAGVRVYALEQRANEIVITFPKAFHAGFNHGVRFFRRGSYLARNTANLFLFDLQLNYNEAVNFATREWLSDDLACVRKCAQAPLLSGSAVRADVSNFLTDLQTRSSRRRRSFRTMSFSSRSPTTRRRSTRPSG